MYCKISYLKSFCKLFVLQAVCMLGCAMVIMMFPGLISFKLGEILYTFASFVIFFDLFFTYAWSLGSKHRRDINIHNRHLSHVEEAVTYSYKSGALLGGIYASFCLILCIICLAASNSAIPGISVAGNMIFKLWFIEYFVAFKYIVRMNNLVCILIALSTFVPIFTGFICGIKNANYIENFMNNIIYRKTK